ncbi:right-handed parallel beta-helix repeat-containing protein [Phytohabitans sp. ZYX-F-186]|uniref:Right-handed parallel beta-helix repeat-containing protein n=1 Tax=Phytohabitans maris TaxID=3071409 RepID=A0ABU0ZN56_9ACTN|nr:right-handed parallel beta-helix repeat-containing protein [Phytohabitans sp. ZYX-F-186]MDQ7908471.1 right-handed parallel beta-helix repeat-containing protein [Phytohabitans sp. ZYX-F-186]
MKRAFRPLRVGAGIAVGAVAALVPLTPAAAEPEPKPEFTVEQAERQTALVAAEDSRLNQVRAVTAVARLEAGKWTTPYRLNTGSGYTLVLTQRSEPYTVTDLLKLAPQTFVRQGDGSYLLTENIYVNLGAKLKLANPGGLTVRLASGTNGFVAIVSFGGQLMLEGTAQAPVKITSWDQRAGKADTDVTDGRAYLRAIGGQFAMANTEVSDLGFWSGRTGGLSLTGTDRPNTGQIEGPDEVPEGTKPPAPGSGGVTAQPSGPLTTPDSRFDGLDPSYTSGKITKSVVRGNAFGIFISSGNGITIADTTVERSLEDGIVLHRFVTAAAVERVTAKGNGGDGFIMSRATQQVRVTGSTAEGNAGNGFTLSGAPLADGPSASGQSTANYGSNSVSSSVAVDNGRYGIEVVGGFDVGVQNNRVEGSDMGIVARLDSDKVAITGNQLSGQRRQGIAIRDSVSGATVTGNVITGADTGIYLRDSVAEVRGNTVQDATNHGISLVGDVAKSQVSYNVIAGVGPSALDTPRSHGKVEIKENQTFAWHDTSSFWIRFRHYASPMTMLWAGILLLIVFSAVKGAGRRARGIRHPYADKAPLPVVMYEAPGAAAAGARGRARVPAVAR